MQLLLQEDQLDDDVNDDEPGGLDEADVMENAHSTGFEPGTY